MAQAKMPPAFFHFIYAIITSMSIGNGRLTLATTFLHQLPAILLGIASCIGAWAAYHQSLQNALSDEQIKAKINEHGEKLDEAAQKANAARIAAEKVKDTLEKKEGREP